MSMLVAALPPCRLAVLISIKVLLLASPIALSERTITLKVETMPTVITSSGPLVGRTNDGIQSFKGIPFARPPVGDLRFMAPEPPMAWTSPKDASDYGVACMQTLELTEISEEDHRTASEDCLTLNIWTPDSTSGNRPVLVFVHGGAFSWGTARDTLYDGHKLAKRGDIVVVTVQYRLGPWGWLDLSSFGGANSSGNNGLLDQLAALRWLQDNAAAFGGDPGNVTLSGESAGGISTSALLTNSAAGNTFHRAILQSGASANVRDKVYAKEVTTKFLMHAGALSIGQLQALTAQELNAAAVKFFDAEAFADIAFAPVVDGVVVEQYPTVALRDGGATSVPVLCGTTRDEARYWLLAVWYLAYLPIRVVYPWLNDISGGRATEILNAYLVDRKGLSAIQQALAAVGSSSFTMPAIRLAEALSGSTPVWMYLFTLESNQGGGRLGSPHAMELLFTFGNLDQYPSLLDPTDNMADYQQVAVTVQDAWIAFVRGGNPSTDALGEWPVYNTESRQTMLLDSSSSLVPDPFSVERTIWGDIPFDGITPPLMHQTPLTHPATNLSAWGILDAFLGGWAMLIIIAAVSLCAFGCFQRRRGATEEVELA